MALVGTAIGIGHGGVGLRSSCQDSCIREGHVLTLVEVCDVRVPIGPGTTVAVYSPRPDSMSKC